MRRIVFEFAVSSNLLLFKDINLCFYFPLTELVSFVKSVNEALHVVDLIKKLNDTNGVNTLKMRIHILCINILVYNKNENCPTKLLIICNSSY